LTHRWNRLHWRLQIGRLDLASRIPPAFRELGSGLIEGAPHAIGNNAGVPVSQPTRLRVALFGAGLVGQAAHAPTLWDDRDRFDFVAVADPSAIVRTAVAERYGIPNACASLEDALSLGLDAVVIAIPDPAHRSAVVTALRAGVHVFCEKPLAVSLAECDEILAARGDRVATYRRA
jgi:hypothetical protein